MLFDVPTAKLAAVCFAHFRHIMTRPPMRRANSPHIILQ